MTNTVFENILSHKKDEVAKLKNLIQVDPHHPVGKILQGQYQPRSHHSFKEALRQSSLAVIAEIKRQSPSKGLLSAIPDPIQLAKTYVSGGASALSILTDKFFFNGDVADLNQVANALSTPILRKDFLIDEIQIAEAFAFGASAILCIVSILGKRTKQFIEFAHTLGIDALVEIHTSTELKIAVDCGAQIIGINNRNLKTFDIDTERSFELIAEIPTNIIKVAESGITEPALAKKYYRAGFNAVLIGEALVTSKDPARFIRTCCDE